MFMIVRIMDADQIYKNLGSRIRSLRKALGWTQDRLAKTVGISRASLANIEAGRQQVLVHHLFGIAKALNLESPSHLLLAPQGRPLSKVATSDLPLAEEGLTEKQRREVLSLMGDVFENSNNNSGKEGA